ncbi:hypothetical protein MNBD_ALPHA03-1578 [hydrothermal vent metagenome]|uniref:ParD protein (Antitoxin to ParE) n=1 Tax=hydrothermal vent metagenome TaxID=652676 RepID=A0A3B1BE11_9ZZZZ
MAIVKTTLSLTDQDRKWMEGVILNGEFVSNSEYVRSLIRRDKERRIETPEEMAYIRAKLLKSEQSGFTTLNRNQILAESKKALRENGEL